MTVTKTKKQAHDYMNKLKGYWWDFDGAFGAQCFDLANMYWNYLTGGRLAGYYAKDIPTANNFNGLATVHKNTPNFLPQKGDIVIFHGGYGGGAGKGGGEGYGGGGAKGGGYGGGRGKCPPSPVSPWVSLSALSSA